MLDKAAGATQTKATWQVTVRAAPAWIEPKGKPKYRPYLVLALDTERGLIRLLATEEQRPTSQVLLSLLTNAMVKPMIGAGGRYRPARIVLDDRELVEGLAAPLAEIGIRCEYAASLPAAEAALREVTAHMGKDDGRASLMGAPGITQPLLADFYAAAEYFYRQTPWRWVDNLATIEVRYPADSPAVRYAVIMGFGGQEFGLAVFPTAQDMRLQYQNMEPEQLMRKMTAMSVTFGEPDLLSFPDLDAISSHGWPIAGPDAYPLVMKTIPPGELRPLSAAELALLAAALRTLPDFVTQHRLVASATLGAAEATYSLSNVHANQRIAYLFPARIPELEGMRQAAQRNDQELEEMIEQWHHDEPSHAFARQVGALLLDFMNSLEEAEMSEQTLRKHEGNAWLIGKFTCDYRSDKPFTPAIFLGAPAYLAEFRRKVSPSAAALDSYQATWRRLSRFIREQGYVQ
jgi:hypothetical protein